MSLNLVRGVHWTVFKVDGEIDFSGPMELADCMLQTRPNVTAIYELSCQVINNRGTLLLNFILFGTETIMQNQ